MRLGFYYHVPALKREGRIYVPGYLGVFLDALARECEQVVAFLHAPCPGEESFLDYPIRAENLIWAELKQRTRAPWRMLFSFRFTRLLQEWKPRLDGMLIRGPSPLLPAMAQTAHPLPVALLLVGDYLAGVDDLPQPGWRKELIRLWAKWYGGLQLKVAQSSLTFVNSAKLFRELQPHVPHLKEVRTTTLTQADFYLREDTCQSPPYHLLYTGRMDRAKGLFEMVEALSLLVERGEDVILDLVGWPQPGDRVVEEILSLANERGVGSRVRYHGYQPLGPALFEFYKKADLYLIASKSSFEGFPRTIWEAMAHSLPVIATRVGSIPDFIEGKAVLIPPKSVEDIVYAVGYIIRDSEERRRMIREGLLLARANTLEAQTMNLVNLIRDAWFPNENH